jgi:hypothetical protein
MGLLDGLLGNASEIEVSKIEGDFAQVMSSGERIEKAYQLIRDLFVFTNKRLFLVDKQGLTGNKVEYHSLPYKNITHFQHRDRRALRSRCGTKDLDLRQSHAYPEAIQQATEHLPCSEYPGRLRAGVVALQQLWWGVKVLIGQSPTVRTCQTP